MKGQLLNALIKISAEINSTMELDTLLPDIVKITGDYLKVRNASIMLIDWDTLTINCYTGRSPHHNSLSVKQGIIGDVAGTGTEYIVNKKQNRNLRYGSYEPELPIDFSVIYSLSPEQQIEVLHLLAEKDVKPIKPLNEKERGKRDTRIKMLTYYANDILIEIRKKYLKK